MALEKNRLSNNSLGPFFVDSSCIDCGSCWQIAPKHFAPAENRSFVHTQPKENKEVQKALMALVDCPVAAIGAPKELIAQIPENIFPQLIRKHSSGDIYYCGWSSKKSFGASSWLIIRPEGNVLIDSPRWSTPLAKTIAQMGGVKHMLLTHGDDVADHELWSKSFHCERWIHENDASAAPQVENLISEMDCLDFYKDLKLIHTPGHTAGSIVILLGRREQIIFSGDHLWWNPDQNSIVASPKYCWWNWSEQIKSIKKLLNFDISLILPGHGHAHEFLPGEWRKALEKTLLYIEANNHLS